MMEIKSRVNQWELRVFPQKKHRLKVLPLIAKIPVQFASQRGVTEVFLQGSNMRKGIVQED